MAMERSTEMEGGKETETETEEVKEDDCSFIWDETSQLYFHSRSGFYHDPNGGWYYSSRDGLYYKFENGSYVLLESDKAHGLESNSSSRNVPNNPIQNESSRQVYFNSEENISSLPADQSDAYQCSGGDAPDGNTLGQKDCNSNQASENPPPPSEWLEEALINLYLSGYNQAVNSSNVSTMSFEGNDGDHFNCSTDGTSHDDNQMSEGDWVSEQHCSLTDQHESIIDEDAFRDEENWKAQYGQVVHSGEQPVLDFHVVELWDWAVVTGFGKDRKGQTSRLVGRLVKQSAKLHPSMPSSGGRFKSAPICEAHLDLVRVRTGQVYKLRTPSARYLSSLASYDSSNPTKDWGFPELSINIGDISLTKSLGKSEAKLADEDIDFKEMFMPSNQLSTAKKQRIHEYRDRAAERRTLHGGFGVGPGQKSSLADDVGGSPSPSTSTEEAAAEALNMSFGAGSYARKLLENMGWKEGEALGKSRKGLITPIEAVGNMGSAGLGWPQR